MTRFRAVFFDMDGVLYDSMPLHEYTWTAVFSGVGIALEPSEAYMNEGRTGRGTINTVFEKYLGRQATPDEAETLYAQKSSLMATMPPPPQLPHMADIVDRLRTEGVDVYVVTGSKQQTLLDRLAADYRFDRQHIVCGADVQRGKPDPEPYLIALRRAGRTKNECAVVENAPLGIRSAKAAGLFCIAVNTGKLTDECLKAEGADELFRSTTALFQHMPDVF